MPLRNQKMKKNESQVIWNTNKSGGWSKYKEMTENNEELEHIIESADNLTPNETMKRMENVSTKINTSCKTERRI